MAEAWRLPGAIQDVGNQIANALGINVTPAAVIIRDGRMSTAQTVPSTRQLHALLDEVHTLRIAREVAG